MAALHDAINEGDFAKVSELVGSGSDVNNKDKDGDTPLHLAVQMNLHQNMNVINFLLSNGANIHAKNERGETPLLRVVGNRSSTYWYAKLFDLVKLLLGKHADINEKTKEGNTLLHFVAHSADNLAGIESSRGVSFLLESGADVHAKNERGETPLHCAASRGNVRIIETLLDKGAKIDERDKKGNAPLDFSTHVESSLNHLQILFGKGEIKFPAVQCLVKRGANINQNNGDNKAVLFYFVRIGHFEGIKFLLNAGAKPNGNNGDYPTHLHAAVRYRHLDAIKLLHAKGAIINAKDDKGQTPLFSIVDDVFSIVDNFWKNKAPDISGDIVDFLIRNDAKINEPDKDGKTVLHQAASNDYTAAQTLVRKGASVHAKAQDGGTPLHIAAERGHLNMVKLLVENNAEIAEKNNKGETPLDVARQKMAAATSNSKALYQSIIDCLNETAAKRAAQEGAQPVVARLAQSAAPPLADIRTPAPQPAAPAQPAWPAFGQIQPNVIQKGEFLGKGGYGIVYKGTWLGTTVAIKELLVQGDEKLEKEFAHEANQLARLNHDNIIGYRGFIKAAAQPSTLVMEYASQGDLNKLIYSDNPFPWDERMRISHEIALALNYLHQSSPKTVHCDLKPANVLLGRGGVVKVSDFGLAKTKATIAITTARGIAGTPVYMAPELTNVMPGQAPPQPTPASDIFAFAILMWELAARKEPYDGYNMFQVMAYVASEKRLAISNEAPQYCQQLIARCWKQTPEDRDSAQKVVEVLSCRPT